jgi:hypothetical protein
MHLLVCLYISLGAAQIVAFLAGIKLWLGIGMFWGTIIFLISMLAPFGPIANSGLAFYGAYRAWHWPFWAAALLTFPFAIMGIFAIAVRSIGVTALFLMAKSDARKLL